KKIAFGSEATGKARVIIQKFQGEERILLNLEEDEEAAVIGGPAIWNPQSNIVYYVVSKHSRTTLYAHPIGGEKETALPFPEGTVAMPKISKDGKILIALHSSMTSPFGIYLHEIGSDSVCPLTPRDFNFDLSLLTRPQSIWYKSFDDLDIHGWYVPAATGKSPHPAIIHPHGGPWGQVFDDWNFGMFEQMVSQNGYAIFAPNFRGSTGYGSEFQNLDIGDPGGGDLEDVIYGTEWLRKQQDVDENKIAITGGSYGGYLTLLALTKKPDSFVTGIARVPVVNWVETYRLSDPFFQQYERTLFGGPPRKKIKELYIDRSPSTYISNIKAPVMIMAGKEDSRCPIEPIEKFIEKLKEMNHPHEFMLIEKVGHISAMFNWEISIPLLTKTMDFFKKNLK
ncbi:MAG: prolyl oligopeptidase family serine peptidase, partial [Promethearchaeota archaeon]